MSNMDKLGKNAHYTGEILISTMYAIIGRNINFYASLVLILQLG